MNPSVARDAGPASVEVPQHPETLVYFDKQWLMAAGCVGRNVWAYYAEPFGIDTLDDDIPYKLPADRAVQFYAESAALVACVLSSRQWELYALLKALQQGAERSNDSLDYDLPKVEQPGFWRTCVERWIG